MDKIVVAYDGSDHARRALERVAAVGQAGGGVTVVAAVHVLPHAGRGPGSGPIDRGEEAERRKELEDAREFLTGKGVDVRTVAGVGDPADVIIEEAKEWGADLISWGRAASTLASVSCSDRSARKSCTVPPATCSSCADQGSGLGTRRRGRRSRRRRLSQRAAAVRVRRRSGPGPGPIAVDGNALRACFQASRKMRFPTACGASLHSA
jgi:hypothetical protein